MNYAKGIYKEITIIIIPYRSQFEIQKDSKAWEGGVVVGST